MKSVRNRYATGRKSYEALLWLSLKDSLLEYREGLFDLDDQRSQIAERKFRFFFITPAAINCVDKALPVGE